MYAGILLIAAALTQTPAPAADVDVAAQVRLLMLDLDVPQRALRDAAEQKLIDLGPAALAHLPIPGTPALPEMELRVNRVRAALYRRRVEQSMQASVVSCDFRDAPLKDVLAEIEKQTGNRLVDFRRKFGQQADEIRVTLAADRKPFWEALNQLLSTEQLQPYHYSGEDGLALVSAGHDVKLPQAPLPVCYSGAFRIEARQMILTRNFTDAGPELQIDLFVDWEPRLRPMFLTAAAAKAAAGDGSGQALAPRNPDAVREIAPQGKACRVEVSLSFYGPSRSVQKLDKLAGTFDVLLPAELHEFRFANPGGDATQQQRAAAATVSVESPRKAGDAWEIPLRLRYDNAGNALESHRAWFYKNPAYFETVDGVRTAPSAVELTGQSPNELSLKLVFPAEFDWSRQALVYQAPADIVALPVAFEFRDLILP